MRARSPSLVAALCLTFSVTAPVAAQARFDFVPYAGLYIPTGKVVDQFSSGCGCQVSVKQKTNFTVGGRVTMWLPGRVGLEGTFGYSPSGATAAASGFGTADTSANLITASAKVLVRVSAPGASTSFHIGAGLGLVGHGGAAYTDTKGTTDFGGLAVAGVAFKVSRLLSLRLDAEDYLFNAQFDNGAGTSTNSKFQNDLVLSLGLAIPLGGR